MFPIIYRLARYPEFVATPGTKAISPIEPVQPVQVSNRPLEENVAPYQVPLLWGEASQSHSLAGFQFLACIDFSDLSDISIDVLRTTPFLAKHQEAKFNVVGIADSDERNDKNQHAERWIREQLMELAQMDSGPSLKHPPHIKTIKASDPASGLIHLSQNEAGTILVLGAHEKSKNERLHLGSVSEAVLKEAHSPVFIHRHRGIWNGIQKILVPIDDTQHALMALSQAIHFAQTFAAQILILHIGNKNEGWETELLRRIDWQNIKHDVIQETGSVAETIAGCAYAHAIDLIIMGTHRESSSNYLIPHGVTVEVVRRSPCPVFVVHPY